MLERAQDAGLVAATAANLAGWHELMLRALGHVTRHEAGLWLTPERVPVIFFSAIAIRPGASSRACATETNHTTWVAACDPWSDLTLAGGGFSIEGDHPWMVRQPGPIEAAADTAGLGSASRDVASATSSGAPPELRVQRVTDPADLADFEVASAIGFGSPPQPPFTWHAPSVLADPRLHTWIGRVDGTVVSTSMSFVDAGVVGVYGVSTIPSARRHGYARAMTVAALNADPSLPSVLQPSPMAEPLYRQLGYRRFTTFRTWVRPAGPTTPGRTP